MLADAEAILKKFAQQRELPMSSVAETIPKKFGDHRDYYTLANLISAGYLDFDVRNGSDPRGESRVADGPTMQLAVLLYTMTLGPGERQYKNMTLRNDPDFDQSPVYCTAKTDLYFAERDQRRRDQFAALGIGIIIAVVSVFLTAVFVD